MVLNSIYREAQATIIHIAHPGRKPSCTASMIRPHPKERLMTELLANHARRTAGRPVTTSPAPPGTPLFDPVLGTELVRVDATGLDLAAGVRLCPRTRRRRPAGLTYRQRAAMLAAVVKVLQAHRDAYYEIATANSGTVKNDSAVDIDGGIFTLGTYAKLGERLGDRRFLPMASRAPGQGPAVPVAARAHTHAAAWRCSSMPSTSRAGACGKRPRPRCCRACRWSSSRPRPRPG
jgi:hypothetical protein